MYYTLYNNKVKLRNELFPFYCASTISYKPILQIFMYIFKVGLLISRWQVFLVEVKAVFSAIRTSVAKGILHHALVSF